VFGLSVEEMALMIPILAVSGFIFLGALSIVYGGKKADRSQELVDEETRLIQDIYHGLLKMEERVESLETLLLDREKRGDRV
jgi:phage shock protein B